jgi:hypothetical protein
LGITAIIFEPISVGAAADDIKAVVAQGILQCSAIFRDIFEEDDSLLTRLSNPR